MKRKHIFLYLFTPLFVEWGISWGMQILALIFFRNISEHLMLFTMVVSILTIPVALHLYKKDGREKQTESSVPLFEWLKIVGMGVVVCIFLNMLITLLDLQRFSTGYQEVSGIVYESSRFLQVLSTGIVAPILEELIYRGLLYGRMREFVSRVPATLCSSVVFGICHGNLVQFVFASCIGVILCCVYEKYGKITTSIWMHMTVNLTSLLLTWMLAGR